MFTKVLIDMYGKKIVEMVEYENARTSVDIGCL